MRVRLATEALARGFTQPQIDEGMVVFARASAQDMMQVIEGPIAWFGRQIDACVPGRLSALAAADLAEAVAQFNVHCEERPHALRMPAAAAARESRAHATQLLRDLYTALRKGDLGVVLNKATVEAAWAVLRRAALETHAATPSRLVGA